MIRRKSIQNQNISDGFFSSEDVQEAANTGARAVFDITQSFTNQKFVNTGVISESNSVPRRPLPPTRLEEDEERKTDRNILTDGFYQESKVQNIDI